MKTLPLTYAIRNLLRSPGRLLQLVAGSTAVVLLVMGASALNSGMKTVLANTGSYRNAILLGAGSEESVERSEVPANAAGIAAASIRGIDTRLGQPAVSPEVHFNGMIETREGRELQALLRGVSEKALLVHADVRVLEGDYPEPGKAMVGKLAYRKLGIPSTDLAQGKEIKIGGSWLEIGGVFEAPGTVMEGEIWVELNQLMALAQRNSISCVVLRLTPDGDFADVDLFTKQRLDLELTAMLESDYYSKLSKFYRPLRGMTWLTAMMVAVGAVFGGLNTLYAALAARIREMGTLQAIGFSRSALFWSLLTESVLATLTGTVLAAWISVMMLDGVTVPFSIGTFTISITLETLILGIFCGILLAIAGTLPPSWKCLQPTIPTALKNA